MPSERLLFVLEVMVEAMHQKGHHCALKVQSASKVAWPCFSLMSSLKPQTPARGSLK